jgi:hypothetical protein
MIPIISHEKCPGSGEAAPKQKVIDDVVYGFDNFGGVGFTSLDIEKAWPDEKVASQIEGEISNLDTGETFRRWLDSMFPNLNTLFCPNRWIFRILADVLTILLIIFNFAALFIYRIRAVKERFGLIHLGVIIVTALLWFVLFLHDPYWAQHIGLVALFAFLCTIGYVFLKTLGMQNRRHYP